MKLFKTVFTATLVLCVMLLSVPTIAASPIWIEGEDASSIPEGLEKRALSKVPASGRLSLVGKSFGKKGNIITFDLELPQNMEDAQMTLRYSRLHVMDWTAAEATFTITAGDKKIVRDEIMDQSGGWGTQSGKEWTLHTVKIGDLPAGKVHIEIEVQKDNSDLNLDGFFLTSGPLTITAEDFKSCKSTQISSEGLVGLQIANTAINQNEFSSIKVIGKGFRGDKVILSADLLDEDGKVHMPVFKNKTLNLSSDMQAIEITPADLEGLADGSYSIKVHWDNGTKSVNSPLVAMGNLLSKASAKADEYEKFSASLKDVSPEMDKRCRGDFDYAVDYIRNALVLLKSRDGKYNANDSKHKIALSYFEKAVQRTAANFSADLSKIIAQTDETIRRINAGQDPYANRSGDLRRGFYSDFSGMLEPYRVLIPESYWKSSNYKFLLALHGAGGDENYYPENDKGSFARAADRLEYLVASPKANLRYRNGGEKDLKQLVDIMQAEYPSISADKLFCTGVSMGGGGTFRMALAYPKLFTAVSIVSSGMRSQTVPENFDNFKYTPVLIQHGKLDGVAPVKNAYRLESELKKRNFTCEIEVYPKYGHAYYGEEYLNRADEFFRKFIK